MIINNTVGGNGCLTQLQRQRSLLELLQSSPHLLHLLRKGTIIRTCQRLQRKDVSTFCNSFIFIFCIHKLYINTYREQLITYYDFDLLAGLVVLRIAEVAQFQEKILRAILNGDLTDVVVTPQQM